MRPFRAAGQSEYCSLRVHVPVRRPHSGERGDNVHSAAVLHLARKIFAVVRFVDQPHAVPPAVPRRGGGSNKTVFAVNYFAACMCKQEAARAVCVLHFARFKTALAEQRGLLIARNAAHRQASSHKIYLTVLRAAGFYSGQHGAGNVQELHKLLVPVAFCEIVQHRAGGVGVVRQVYAAAGELPHKPGVNGAEQQFARVRLFPCTGHVVQDPLDLCAAEVRVDLQTCNTAYKFRTACPLEFSADIRGAAALPYDGIIHRPPGSFFPHYSGLALIRDTYGGNLFRSYSAAGNALRHGSVLARVYLQRVLFHPAGFREDLRYFVLRDGNDVHFFVEQNAARAGRALIEGEDVLFH